MSNALKLGDVAVVKGGSGFPEKYQGGSHGLPFIKVSDMNLPGNQRYIWKSNNYLNTTVYNLLKPTVFPRDTVVFAKVGAAVYLNKRRILTEDTAIDNNLMGVTATAIEPLFLYYLLQSIDLAEWVQPGALPSINQTIIEALPIPITDRKQQRYISEVLNALDNQIDATQALIDKYTAIKQGMMVDLFSRGIDPETKALRPTFEEAPELYHKTPLGMLPNGWVCAPIKKFVQSAEYGISTSLNDDSSGIPVLRMNNIQNSRFNVEDLKFTKVPEAYRLKLSTGDVLYNRTNSMEHVGKTAIWRGELAECSFASYLVRINVNKCELLPEYFSFWMSQESSQNALRAFATPAVQQVNINPTNLQRVLMSCPVSLLEQREIVDRIDAADAVLLREREALLKLNAQKSGLMQDLLTDKVPVPA